jgi:Protein of unknown function (DUF642)
MFTDLAPRFNSISSMTTIKRLLLPALLVPVFLQNPATAQNLISGGGFETPALAPLTILTLSAGDGTLSPWTIGGQTVDLVAKNGGSVIGEPFGGNQFLDLSGTPGPGVISQAFTTTPGETYFLRFAYANNYAGSPEGAAANILISDAQGVLLTSFIQHNTSAPSSLDWTVFTAVFTAREGSATVSFQSTTPGLGGILLDEISIEAFAGTNGVPVPVEIHKAVAITFESVPARYYQPQFSASLAPDDWVSFGGVILGNGITQTVFDRADLVPKRFYRVLDLGVILGGGGS